VRCGEEAVDGGVACAGCDSDSAAECSAADWGKWGECEDGADTGGGGDCGWGVAYLVGVHVGSVECSWGDGECMFFSMSLGGEDLLNGFAEPGHCTRVLCVYG